MHFEPRLDSDDRQNLIREICFSSKSVIVSQTRIDSICQKLLERPCFFQGLENVFESFFSFLFFGSIHVRDVAKEMKKFAV